VWYVLFAISTHYYKLTISIEIKHSLKEWENGKKAHETSFSEESAKHSLDWIFYFSFTMLIGIYFSYAHHLGNWKRMSSKAPAWVKFWKMDLIQKLLYDFILYNSQL